jgi:hypothetical protein
MTAFRKMTDFAFTGYLPGQDRQQNRTDNKAYREQYKIENKI